MAGYTVHNVKFYNFVPKSIQCMSYENESSRLALSRADGSIEIWNCQDIPFMQKVLPGAGEDESSVEGLAWSRGRLFSAGLHGFILEHDLVTDAILSRTAVTGGPTWCLSSSPSKTMLAAGTEEGYLNVFKVVEGGITFEKILEKQEGRILHLSWHCSEDYIVTGSINYVRLCSLKNMRMMNCKIASISGREVIVWCVGILDDMTIVSGDSRGNVCFWNGNLGILTDSVQTHKADVLSLLVGSDQETVYAAGVDPLIVLLKHVGAGIGEVGKKECWIKSISRKIHTHDVRAMALVSSDKIFSGGVDTFLSLSCRYPTKMFVRFHASPHRGSISVAGAASCLLLKQLERLELWRLGSHFPASDSEKLSSKVLPLHKDRVKLLEVRSPGGEMIDWCAVSPEACWIAYIVKQKLRILQFYPPKVDSKASLRRVRGMSKDIQPSLQAVWLREAKLASAATSGVIQVLNMSEMETNVESELTLKPGHGVLQMCASPDGNTLVVVDSQNEVTAFNVKSGDGVQLPVYRSWVTAVGVDPTNQFVLVAYADMRIHKFSLSLQCFIDLNCKAVKKLKQYNFTIRHISFDSCHPERILLHNDDYFFIILNKTGCSAGSEEEGKPPKITRNLHSSDTTNSSSNYTHKKRAFIKRSNYVLHFSHVRENSVVSVELDPREVLDKLPPILKVKKFGAG